MSMPSLRNIVLLLNFNELGLAQEKQLCFTMLDRRAKMLQGKLYMKEKVFI